MAKLYKCSIFVITDIGVRANIHLGGANRVCPNGFGGGGSSNKIPWSIFCGGVVAEIFRDPYSVGGGSFRHLLESARFGGGGSGRIFSVNCSNRPSIRVIQTCIVFCPNNVDSLPELMSTNCPNWGGNCPHPVRL